MPAGTYKDAFMSGTGAAAATVFRQLARICCFLNNILHMLMFLLSCLFPASLPSPCLPPHTPPGSSNMATGPRLCTFWPLR